MGTASDKVFLQSAIRPGRTHLPEPLEFAIFIRTWKKKKCASLGTLQIVKGTRSHACARGGGDQLSPFQPGLGAGEREMSWLVCASSTAKPGKGSWRSPGVCGTPGRGCLGDRHRVCDSSCALAAPGLGWPRAVPACATVLLWNYGAPQRVTPPLGHHAIPKDTTPVHGTPQHRAVPCHTTWDHSMAHHTTWHPHKAQGHGFCRVSASPDAVCSHSHPPSTTMGTSVLLQLRVALVLAGPGIWDVLHPPGPPFPLLPGFGGISANGDWGL